MATVWDSGGLADDDGQGEQVASHPVRASWQDSDGQEQTHSFASLAELREQVKKLARRN